MPVCDDLVYGRDGPGLNAILATEGTQYRQCRNVIGDEHRDHMTTILRDIYCWGK